MDWLSFTCFPTNPHWQDALRHFLSANFGVSGWVVGQGWRGYESSARVEGVLIAWGGEAQRGSVYVDIPGAVCGACRDWRAVVEWLETLGARLTRVDIAGDDYEGGALSVDWALGQAAAGGFVSGGHPPKFKLVDDLGSGEGRTLYVGKRGNGKLARIYDKGKQLGDKLSSWCRFEVEWRNKDRVLPFAMLLRPAEFLAGAFPCAAFFSMVAERLRTVRERATITYARAVQVARLHAGRVVNAILQVTHGDVGAVVGLLLRSGLPQRISSAEIAALAGPREALCS